MKVVAEMIDAINGDSNTEPVRVWLTDLARRAVAPVVDEFLLPLDFVLFATSGKEIIVLDFTDAAAVELEEGSLEDCFSSKKSS